MLTEETAEAAGGGAPEAASPPARKKKIVQTVRLPSGLIATVKPGKAKHLMRAQELTFGKSEIETVTALIWALAEFREPKDDLNLDDAAAVTAFLAGEKRKEWVYEDLGEELEIEDFVRLQGMVLGGNFTLPPALTSRLSSISASKSRN
jgi:hypothetical protein